MHNDNKIQRWSSRLAGASALLLAGTIFFSNTMPLGANRSYSSGDKTLSMLGPKSRVKLVGQVSVQQSDLAYFNANSPFYFDTATVRMKLRNPSTDQTVELGYKDQEQWHYSRLNVSDPLIDELNWSHVGEGTALYQRSPTYKDIRGFLSNPPQDKLIGTYDYDSSGLTQSTAKLAGYVPAKEETSISTPLRGKVTMYAYLNNENFKATITKRDLNWYGDPDVVTAKVYKGSDEVFSATIDDDGNDTDNRRLGEPQDVTIENPGPGVPEPGVYKIVIDAPGDSVITGIRTNLSKLAFEGPLYVAANNEIYGDIVPATIPTTLVTNAQALTFIMDHDQTQTITAGSHSLKIATAGQSVALDTGVATSTVTIPKSDVVVNGVGYFGFSAEQFFQPTPYHIVPITKAADLDRVDYVLTNYRPPKKLADGWVEVERTFDLRDAVVQNGKLSWVLAAPGLQAAGRTIEVKDISMTLSKKGWFQ